MWVFAQFNVPEEGNKIDSYYYYGRISESLFKDIKENKVDKGFLLIEDVKYWGNDDLIYDHADNENVGSLVFRIEDIRRIRLIKVEPFSGKGSEQFDDIKAADLPVDPLNIVEKPVATVVETIPPIKENAQ